MPQIHYSIFDIFFNQNNIFYKNLNTAQVGVTESIIYDKHGTA